MREGGGWEKANTCHMPGASMLSMKSKKEGTQRTTWKIYT